MNRVKTETPSFKNLTEVEVQSKREKGLCFCCDEKFSLGHYCKDKILQVLVVSERMKRV